MMPEEQRQRAGIQNVGQATLTQYGIASVEFNQLIQLAVGSSWATGVLA